jgi:hypothetical protein
MRNNSNIPIGMAGMDSIVAPNHSSSILVVVVLVATEQITAAGRPTTTSETVRNIINSSIGIAVAVVGTREKVALRINTVGDKIIAAE